MKIILTKIFCSKAVSGVLALPIVLLLGVPTLAATIPQRVTNGLYRSSSQDFFERGRRQFDREIQILLDREFNKPGLLEISEELRRESDRIRELPNLSPNESDRMRKKKTQRLRVN